MIQENHISWLTIQNNITLKLIESTIPFTICWLTIQNNITLKQRW